MKFHEKAVLQQKALGKLSAVEVSAIDKLIAQFGNPLEEELQTLREKGRQAGLTEAELQTLQTLALRQGLDQDAALASYETGKLSPAERSVVKKLLDHFGHPHADVVEALNRVTARAKLSTEEVATLKGLVARAGWDPAAVLKIKQADQLSPAESAAVAKAEGVLGKLEYYVDTPREDEVRVLFTLTRLAGLTAQETDAAMALAKQIDFKERRALERKQAGTLSAPESEALAKLEGLLGKLEDIVDSPYKDTLAELLDLAAKADLSLPETRSVTKLAVRVEFDRDAALQLKAEGKLNDLESKAVDKLAAAERQ